MTGSRRAAALLPVLLPGAVLLFAHNPATAADIDKWQSYQKSGEESFDSHRYGRAEHYFAKAVREADRTDVGDMKLALSLRKLAEANIAARKYKEAEAHLQRAIKISRDIGAEDREAIRDLLELAKTYRSVNLEQFGQNVATVLKETGLDGIEILNTKDGNSRVVVRFADKFEKHIHSADVNEINVDKKLTFDIHEDKDGTITLSNIKGLRVRSKVWVNLTQSSIDPNGEEGKTTAQITAEKLGLTKTVKTVLPKPVYDKIFNVVERIRHPELHSPWHKQLQEKIGLSTKPKPVPITVTDATKVTGNGADAATAATAADAKVDATTTDASGADAAKVDRAKGDAGTVGAMQADELRRDTGHVDAATKAPGITVEKEVTGSRQFTSDDPSAVKAINEADLNSVKN